MIALIFSLVTVAAAPPLVDNAYVRVVKNAAPCADAGAGCGRRIIVALAPTEVSADGGVRELNRGDIILFEPARS